MNEIYVITSGEYSEYSIHSVWNDEKQAEGIVELLNRQRYGYGDYRVEAHPLNQISQYQANGWRSTYDMEANGYSVDVANIVTVETIVDTYSRRKVESTWLGVVTAYAETVEATHKLIFDEVARCHAEKLKL